MNEQIFRTIMNIENEANTSYMTIKNYVIRNFSDLYHMRFTRDTEENRRLLRFIENNIEDFEFLRAEKNFVKALDNLIGEEVRRIQISLRDSRYGSFEAIKQDFKDRLLAIKRSDLGIEEEFKLLARRCLMRFPLVSFEEITFYLKGKQRKIENFIREKHDYTIDAIVNQVDRLVKEEKKNSDLPENNDNKKVAEKPVINIYIGPDVNLYTQMPIEDGKYDSSVNALNAGELSSILENANIRWIKFDTNGELEDTSMEEISVTLKSILGQECSITEVQSQGGIYSYKIKYLPKNALSSDFIV